MPHGKAGPRVLISYSHDSHEHREMILRFANRLRGAGADAWIDQFEEHDPPDSWPDWMRREVEKADTVVLVITDKYVKSFRRETGEGVGSGVRWEGALVNAELYHTREERAKYIPVVLRASDAHLIPVPLNLTSWFVIGEDGRADLSRLVKVLLREQSEIPGAIGSPKSVVAQSFYFEGVNSSPGVDEAFSSAISGGDVRVSLGELESALEGSFGDERSHILFLQGVLHEKIGEASQAETRFLRIMETSGHAGLREAAMEHLRPLYVDYEAHYGDGGPVTAATEWLTLVRRGKKREMWKRLTRELRLSLAQDWVMANEGHPNLAPYDREDLAEELSAKKPNHPLGKHLLASKVAVLQEHYKRWDAKRWGAARNPRRIGHDYELIVMSPADDGIRVTEEGELVPTFPLLMRKVGIDWAVANFSTAYPVPGWPPSQVEIPAQTVQYSRFSEGDE
ncbi:toll/interleukin-1 receptor domain-containing protein [Streptomyces sp. NPDC016845]|uniref:toll/interleukin-1 receptor domain-containing protein n=1 Tax=Streptomyces sp. NPDC016845 TaxID=3364972 RepID=UPI0037BD5F0E